MKLPTFASLALLALTSAACSSSIAPQDGSADGSPSTDATVTDIGTDVTVAPDTALGMDTVTGTDTVTAPDTITGRDVVTGSDTVSTRDGSILPPSDASNPFGDAGALGPPEWVPIDVRTDSMCEALMACGGDVVGTWDVTGGCVEVPLMGSLSACPGARVTSATGRARGRVTFDATTSRRVAQSEVTLEAFVPSVCAGFLGGCSGVESALQSQVPDSACVTNAAGDCECAARQEFVIDDADGYRIEGNEIVSASLGKRWEYCISPMSSMRYRDTSTSGMREPGIIQLGRR